MPYSVRVIFALVGGVLAACGTITAFAVLLGVHPEDSRWVISQGAAGLGVGLIAAARVRPNA
jgi:D-arabinose 1-dehydrogenase-like Zn-dependent alcohol dehydrogenase